MAGAVTFFNNPRDQETKDQWFIPLLRPLFGGTCFAYVCCDEKRDPVYAHIWIRVRHQDEVRQERAARSNQFGTASQLVRFYGSLSKASKGLGAQ